MGVPVVEFDCCPLLFDSGSKCCGFAPGNAYPVGFLVKLDMRVSAGCLVGWREGELGFSGLNVSSLTGVPADAEAGFEGAAIVTVEGCGL